MKKSLLRSMLALLCAAALLLNLCGSAFAAERAASGEFRYDRNPDGSLTLTGWTGSADTLRIPAQLEGRPVTAIGESCFAGLLCLKRVYVPEGVTELGGYAFESCGELQKIYLPDSLLRIGDGAFSGCSQLALADMQDRVESIGRGAFLCCDSLVQLVLSAALTELGDFAFAGCGSLSSVVFNGSSLHALPDRVFCDCASLSRVKLPAGIDSIGKRAFRGCEKLNSLYFGTPLVRLGEYAFEDCSGLTGLHLSAETIPTGLVTGCGALSWFDVPEGARRIAFNAFGSSGVNQIGIPASVEEIEPGAFYTVQGSLSLDEGNASYRLIDGSLYTADGKSLLAYFPADPYAEEPQTEFTLPEGVAHIASYALAESGLSRVVLPASLEQIDAYAFAGLDEGAVEIPEGVNVDPDAFADPHGSGEDPAPVEPGEEVPPEIIGSVAGDKNLFREEDWADYREIGNEAFDAWCDEYLAWNEAQGIRMRMENIPFTIRYKGEVVPHFTAMAAVQNHDPDMWAQSANIFGDDFEQMYLMMDHGLSTELRRGKMPDNLILYSGLYDSQLMAAAGTDSLPTQEELVEAIGNTFTDPIMISTTTDPGVAAGFGDTLFIIYASREAMEALGALCIDAVSRSSEKEILMNDHAQYRILDVGNMVIEQQEPWDPEPTLCYRGYVKVELLAPEPPAPVFSDVPEDAWYHSAVCWAAANGITGGTAPGLFSPRQDCTRAELMTFLWRAAGSPQPEGGENPFTDVKPGAYYEKAVRWAAEQKISSGTAPDRFSPDKKCTRAEIVSFLYRYAGSPKVSRTEHPFEDVKPGVYYEKAVLWALEQKLTAGTSAHSFSPKQICTRAEAVTFLYKLFQ